ncbi:MAG: hypothetical protein Q9202_006494 [Teloschistes flavicans]
MPQHTLEEATPPEIIRIPLLPHNFFPPRNAEGLQGAVDSVVRPEISTVSANSTHIESPSAMSEVTDNHAIEIDPYNLTSKVTVAAANIAKVPAREASAMRELWGGLLDDLFGPRHSCDSDPVFALGCDKVDPTCGHHNVMSMEHMEDPVLEELNNKETSSLLWALDYNAEYPVPTAASPIANKHVVESHQSSLALPTPNGTLRTPRTANHVRFEIQEGPNDERSPNKIAAEDEAYLEEEDYVSRSTSTEGRRSSSQRAPLLSEVEAPSVTVATTEFEFNTEDLLESARPKSGMGSAFMNMANSIMYASCPTPAGGIIGNRLMDVIKDSRMLFDKLA